MKMSHNFHFTTKSPRHEGKILKTINGGLNWNEQISNVDQSLNSLFLINLVLCIKVYKNISITSNSFFCDILIKFFLISGRNSFMCVNLLSLVFITNM